MQASLIVLDPPAAGRELKLSLPATIGRSREAQFKLVHGQVSRLHCEFFERDGILYVRDLGSKNGTFVGDVQITEVPVRPGDTVTIGSVRVQVIYEPSEDAQFPPVAFAVTDTIRKTGEATIRPQSVRTEASSPKSPSETTETGPFPSVATTAERAAATPQPGLQEGSFDWFDDLTADQAEGSGALSPPPLPPAESSSNVPNEPQMVEGEELDVLEPLDADLPPANDLPPVTALEPAGGPQSPTIEPAPKQPEVASDDSLNILPPPADSSTGEPAQAADLQWRVPEPSSPDGSDFAFHLEQSTEGLHKSKATQNPDASPQPAKNDDDDFEQFLKSLDEKPE